MGRGKTQVITTAAVTWEVHAGKLLIVLVDVADCLTSFFSYLHCIPLEFVHI